MFYSIRRTCRDARGFRRAHSSRLKRLGLMLAALAAVSMVGWTSGGASAAGKKTPIKVMIIGTWNNPLLDTQPWVFTMQAAADYFNKHDRGINGDPIDVIACNDNFSPNGATACANEAVSDHVVALIGGISVFDSDVWPIITAAKIPWLADIPLAPAGETGVGADSYPIGAQHPADAGMAAYAAKHCSSVIDVDAGAPSVSDLKFFTDGAKGAGKTLQEIPVNTASSDLSPYAAQIGQAHADCMILDLNTQTDVALVNALTQSGVAVPHVYAINSLTLTSQMDGWTINSSFSNIYTAPWKQYRAMVKEYSGLLGSGVATDYQDGQTDSWVGIQVLREVADTIKGTVTSTKLIAALNHTKNLSTGGETHTLDFAKPNPVASLARYTNPYFTLQTVKNGKLAPLAPFANGSAAYVAGGGS